MVSSANPLADIVRAMIRSAAGEVLDSEPAALADEADGVHRHRTRVRRLRSILAVLRDELQALPARRLRRQFRAWGTQLGTVRDAEVLAAEADEAMSRAGIDDEAIRRRLADEPLAGYARRHARLVRLSDEPRARERMRHLHAFAADPPLSALDRDAVEALSAVLTREIRRVRTAAKRLDGSVDRLHDVRKAGRRLRYAAEAIAAHGPAELVDAATAAAKAGSGLHDVLGDHRDAVALVARLERESARAARAGEPTLGYDRMIEAAAGRARQRLGRLDAALARVKAAADALP